MSWLYWLIVLFLKVGLTVLTAYEIFLYLQLKKAQVDPIVLCQQLNRWVSPHLYSYFILCFLLLIGKQWIALFFNLPLVLLRIWMISRKRHFLDPSLLIDDTDPKIHAPPHHPFSFVIVHIRYLHRRWIGFTFYFLMSFYYIHRFYLVA